MKSHDEIKKGLECCTSRDCGGSKCPYFNEKSCNAAKSADALALIQQLQAENAEQADLIKYLKAEIEEYEQSADKCCYESQCNAELNQLEALCKRLRDENEQLEAERDAMKEALGLMVYQYCVRGDKLDHLYMCAGETAFRVLGLEQYGDTRTLESWLFPECQEPEA